MGIAPAGTEEQVIRQLHKAGSLDASEILPDIAAIKNEDAAAARSEEVKQ